MWYVIDKLTDFFNQLAIRWRNWRENRKLAAMADAEHKEFMKGEDDANS